MFERQLVLSVYSRVYICPSDEIEHRVPTTRNHIWMNEALVVPGVDVLVGGLSCENSVRRVGKENGPWSMKRYPGAQAWGASNGEGDRLG